MNCAELESRICDYVDGTLPEADKALVESHLAECAACAELVRDSRAAVGFMERAAEVDAPPELITRILFDPPWAGRGRLRQGARGWLGGWIHTALQPRLVMSAAMTILSFSMLAHYVSPVKQFGPEDLQPARVWAGVEDKGYRAWARTVKFYENLKFVYQVQTTLREWRQQQEAEQSKTPPEGADERKLPVKAPGDAKPVQTKPSERRETP